MKKWWDLYFIMILLVVAAILFMGLIGVGGPVLLSPGECYIADVDRDGSVGANDLALVRTYFGLPCDDTTDFCGGFPGTDMDDDGSVGAVELGLVRTYFGCEVSEFVTRNIDGNIVNLQFSPYENVFGLVIEERLPPETVFVSEDITSRFDNAYFKQKIIDADDLARIRTFYGIPCDSSNDFCEGSDISGEDGDPDGVVDAYDTSFLRENFGRIFLTWVIIEPDADGIPSLIDDFIGSYEIGSTGNIEGEYYANTVSEIRSGEIKLGPVINLDTVNAGEISSVLSTREEDGISGEEEISESEKNIIKGEPGSEVITEEGAAAGEGIGALALEQISKPIGIILIVVLIFVVGLIIYFIYRSRRK
jgi:hypothetical protein